MSTQDATHGERRRAAFYGMAVCDALGGPLEFQKRRQNPKDYLREMVSNRNFGLPAGHFTDDTSMALCLAASLAACKGQHDAVDQAARYLRWLEEGYMSSSPGPAFDVGVQTTEVLRCWRQSLSLNTLSLIDTEFNEERRCGNGSLMRVLPCALIATSEHQAQSLAHESSRVTHPHQRCTDACVIYSSLIFHALQGATKDQLVQILQNFASNSAIEAQLRVRLSPYASVADFSSKPRIEISSSGYVLDSLEAALWAFFSTEGFEEGAIEVVNLGNDADTVGAIYGGLSGAFYGRTDCIPYRWLREMKEMHLVDVAVTEIIDVTQKT